MFHLKLYCSLLVHKEFLYINLISWSYQNISFMASFKISWCVLCLKLHSLVWVWWHCPSYCFLYLMSWHLAKFSRKCCLKYCFKFFFFSILPSYINYIFLRCPWLLNVLLWSYLPHIFLLLFQFRNSSISSNSDYFLSPAHHWLTPPRHSSFLLHCFSLIFFILS